ncbi:3-deoxy-D-manno-octulosonic acid kinase [Thioalkalivibrio sp.]|uniref:3-deoxy-D-manno-octulosonic acid kinase n=1 Tax=Thioalkalivibrio sp. TaxID=2093813 RepID=UPI0035649E84
MEWRLQRSGGDYLIHDEALERAPEPWMFEPGGLRQRGYCAGEVHTGRGRVLFCDPPIPGSGGQWVLRHYLRGGSVARILGDRYLWTGLKRSRPWREFMLTHTMRDEGLPVPRPVAARLTRHGLYWRADLITQRVPDALSLHQRLREGSVGAADWHRVGAVIRRFHDAGYCHADLNSRNILIDICDRVWLIDWDRGCWRAQGAWTRRNLERLRRDLEKRRRLHDQWQYADPDFERLLQGYADPRSASPPDGPDD